MSGHVKKRVSSRTGEVTWQARIPRPTSRHQHDVRTFDRKRDAERWLAEEQAKRLRGDYIDPRSAAKPFSSLVETWERTRVAKLAPKTRERYSSVTRTYLLPAFGPTPLGRLTRADIKEFFAGLAQDGITPGTARKVQVVLSSILSEGVELGLLRENPARALRLASSPRRDMTILTAEEVRALAEAMPTPSQALAVWVAAYTGLRAGELWALRRRDLDLPGPNKQARLVVQRTLKDAHGHLEFVHATKTDGSRRVVSLPTFLANMLAGQAPTEPDALLFTGPGGANGRPDGDPTNPVRHGLFVRRVFRPAAKRALPPSKQAVRFHDLRHTCAALLIAAGRHPLEIKQRLGHASITTTMDRYGQLFPSAEAALADALDATYSAGENVTAIHEDAA